MKNSATRGVKDSKGNRASSKRTALLAPVKAVAKTDELAGLRDRIIAELDSANISQDFRVQYLASITGRVFQTVRRWIAADKPGQPDLESLVLLCKRFNSDANWMLGLVPRRYSLPTSPESLQLNRSSTEYGAEDWSERLQMLVQERCAGFEIMTMVGDDMEPRIKEGASIWVNSAITEIDTNGIYLLSYQGRNLVRQVEIQAGDGFLLRCDNPRYMPTLIKDLVGAKEAGLSVLGRVMFSISIDRM